MSNLTKVKLILLGFMMSAVGGYCLGAHNELAAIDQEAFDSYVAVAHQMKAVNHKHSHAKADDVFAKAGF